MGAASWTIIGLISASLCLGEAPDLLCVLLALGAAVLTVLALLGRTLRPLSGTVACALLGWTALALAQHSSEGSAAGALPATAVFAALCVFTVAHAAVPRRDRERLLAAVGVAGALVACAALWRTTPGGVASFPLETPDHLAAWLVLPTLLGVAALCLCAPEGRGARWTIAWFCAVTLCAAALAASHSGGALLALGIAASCLFALSRLPSRRGFTAAVALCALALSWLAPTLRAPGGDAWNAAGFAPVLPALATGDALGRVAALLLPAAFALQSVRPLRVGRGSLAAWGGAGAVFCIAPLGLLGTTLDVPAITLTAATLTGLAWPAPVAGAGDVRRTRVLLVMLAAAVWIAALAGSLVSTAGTPG